VRKETNGFQDVLLSYETMLKEHPRLKNARAPGVELFGQRDIPLSHTHLAALEKVFS
jgi:hypothetical protein